MKHKNSIATSIVCYTTLMLRPWRRCRLMVLRPPAVRIRALKPLLRMRLILLMRWFSIYFSLSGTTKVKLR